MALSLELKQAVGMSAAWSPSSSATDIQGRYVGPQQERFGHRLKLQLHLLALHQRPQRQLWIMRNLPSDLNLEDVWPALSPLQKVPPALYFPRECWLLCVHCTCELLRTPHHHCGSVFSESGNWGRALTSIAGLPTCIVCVETPVLGFGVFGAVPAYKETNVSCTSLGVARLGVGGYKGNWGIHESSGAQNSEG